MKRILCIFVTISMLLSFLGVFPASSLETEPNSTTTGTISGLVIRGGSDLEPLVGADNAITSVCEIDSFLRTQKA